MTAIRRNLILRIARETGANAIQLAKDFHGLTVQQIWSVYRG